MNNSIEYSISECCGQHFTAMLAPRILYSACYYIQILYSACYDGGAVPLHNLNATATATATITATAVTDATNVLLLQLVHTDYKTHTAQSTALL
jgi:hypothetical protein